MARRRSKQKSVRDLRLLRKRIEIQVYQKDRTREVRTWQEFTHCNLTGRTREMETGWYTACQTEDIAHKAC
jgi:hypothetical protein